MKIKQRKSLPWRRFGYVILIIIKFGEVLLWFSPRIINALRSYIKHSKECFIRYPNTLKLVKKTRLRLVFSTHFSVFGYLMKRSSSCLIYYIINQGDRKDDKFQLKFPGICDTSSTLKWASKRNPWDDVTVSWDCCGWVWSLFPVFPASLDCVNVFFFTRCIRWSDFTRSSDVFEAFYCLWFDLDNVHILVLCGLIGFPE